MQKHPYSGPKLPRQLLEQVDNASHRARTGRGSKALPSVKQQRRKATRVEKRTQKEWSAKRQATSSPRKVGDNHEEISSSIYSDEELSNGAASAVKDSVTAKDTATLAQKPLKTESESTRLSLRGETDNHRSSHARIPRATAVKLAEDDAEIKALERALGMRSGKKTPKSFQQDGLDELLGSIDGSDTELENEKKRSGDDTWLQSKRKKAKLASHESSAKGLPSSDASDDSDGDSDAADYALERTSSSLDGEEFAGFEDEADSKDAPKKLRENPYVPPERPADGVGPKYVPPSLRSRSSADHESLWRLERQIKGAFNRLSEANLLAIVSEFEDLYRQNARQHVFSLLLDALYGLICDASTLQDTFMILHAGFVAALHKTIGSEFAARVVERLVEEFERRSTRTEKGRSMDKEQLNLISFLAELYNLRVIGSALIYDYIRSFVSEFSEEHTELLLKIAKISGSQLRQDDPSSLKDIVLLIQAAVTRIGSDNLSVRTRFMIETIESLKNNRLKTGIAASSIKSEHTIRMKKTLGSISRGSAGASEPLRITLNDLRNSDNRGKWWMTGASYRDKDPATLSAHTIDMGKAKKRSMDGVSLDPSQDLIQLAREQRMNTDVRRSIFITVMSSNDYRDATERLLKLRLNKAQQLEIPQVLLHCAGAEKVYNPFYTLISKQLCGHHKVRMSFQFYLWNLFKRTEESDDAPDDDTEDPLSMRTLVNLGKLYGNLIAEGKLSLLLLKNLDLAYLRAKTEAFVEVLVTTVFLDIGKVAGDGALERRVKSIFSVCKEASSMTADLRVFLKRKVSKAGILKDSRERGIVKDGCKYASRVLVRLGTSEENDAAEAEDTTPYAQI